ncbi:hypothetical protein HaLaN_24430, partial [Haematococcus lacustris]
MSLLGAAIAMCMVIATACSTQRGANIAIARGSCGNPVIISNLPSNGVLNIPFDEGSCQDMTNTWQPPPVYDQWWYAYDVWSVGYFLPGDAPVPRLVTLSAGGQYLPYYTFIRYGWCANAGRCNPADLCSLYDRCSIPSLRVTVSTTAIPPPPPPFPS